MKTYKTNRGNLGLNYEKFSFRKDRTLASGDISWRCTTRKCGATLKTNTAVTVVKLKNGIHNHPEPGSPTPSPTSTPMTPNRQSVISDKSITPSACPDVTPATPTIPATTAADSDVTPASTAAGPRATPTAPATPATTAAGSEPLSPTVNLYTPVLNEPLTLQDENKALREKIKKQERTIHALFLYNLKTNRKVAEHIYSLLKVYLIRKALKYFTPHTYQALVV